MHFVSLLGLLVVLAVVTPPATSKVKCADKNKSCKTWAGGKNNYCKTGSYIAYMATNCRESCGWCKEVVLLTPFFRKPCKSKCAKHGYKYWWCTIDNNYGRKWDYCSPNPGLDYKGRSCKDGSKGCKHKDPGYGTGYYTCSLTQRRGAGYCSYKRQPIVRMPKGAVLKTSRYRKPCTSKCALHGYKSNWCNIKKTLGKSWDYCSTSAGRDYKSRRCQEGSRGCKYRRSNSLRSDGLPGAWYCKLSRGGYGYCSHW